MKSLLSRCTLRRSIGLVIEEGQIAISVVSATPLSHRQVFRMVQPCEGESVQAVLEKVLGPLIKSGQGRKGQGRPWVQLGVPESQVFQAAVPITHANRNAPAQTFFLEAVQATNIRSEERIIELIRLELKKQPLACVAASPRAAIESLIELMDGLDLRVGLAEPVPAALCRAGAHSRKPPRGSMLCVRFFLGPQQAIGVVAVESQPLFWHTFDLTPGDETGSILAAYSTLWMLWRNCRIALPIDTVIVHGRPEVALTRQSEAFQQRTGARLIRCDEPNYDPASAALGVALASPLEDEPGLNLARTLKPSPTVRDIFPWGEVAVQGALLGAVSLFLSGTVAEADVQLKDVGIQLKAFSWLKDWDQKKLDDEKKALQDRSRSLDVFKNSRVAWSVPLRSIAAAAPASTVITSLSGTATLDTDSKSNPTGAKKQLTVNFATPMAVDGSLPGEIDEFLESLRKDPSLDRDFPLIEVSGLRANPAGPKGHPFASYTVICLPRADIKANPAR
jgi:hypothetical protein